MIEKILAEIKEICEDRRINMDSRFTIDYRKQLLIDKRFVATLTDEEIELLNKRLKEVIND